MCSSCPFTHGNFSLRSWRSNAEITQTIGLTEQACEQELPSTAFPTRQSLSHPTARGRLLTGAHRHFFSHFASFTSHPAVRRALSFFSLGLSSVPPWNIFTCQIFRTGSLSCFGEALSKMSVLLTIKKLADWLLSITDSHLPSSTACPSAPLGTGHEKSHLHELFMQKRLVSADLLVIPKICNLQCFLPACPRQPAIESEADFMERSHQNFGSPPNAPLCRAGSPPHSPGSHPKGIGGQKG